MATDGVTKSTTNAKKRKKKKKKNASLTINSTDTETDVMQDHETSVDDEVTQHVAISCIRNECESCSNLSFFEAAEMW